MIIFLYILIVAGSTTIGATFSKKHQVHLSFFKELNSFVNILEGQIMFNKNSLKNITKNNLTQYKSPLKTTLNQFFIENIVPNNINELSVEENEYVVAFLKSLGKSDSRGEINNLKFHKSVIKNYLENSSENYKKLGTLGTKLGFIAGVLIIVVLL